MARGGGRSTIPTRSFDKLEWKSKLLALEVGGAARAHTPSVKSRAARRKDIRIFLQLSVHAKPVECFPFHRAIPSKEMGAEALGARLWMAYNVCLSIGVDAPSEQVVQWHRVVRKNF
jgi:hypothetical protein